jgi:hypothetical protein
MFTKGDRWDFWVCLLALIFRDSPLPITIRKDEEGTSAFVAFIREVQARLPPKVYQKRSDSALATAIIRARERLAALDALGRTSIDFLLLMFLGAAKPLLSTKSLSAEIELDHAAQIYDILERADN